MVKPARKPPKSAKRKAASAPQATASEQRTAPDLLGIARKMGVESRTWTAKVEATGEVDFESIARLEALREELLTHVPRTALDAMLQIGACRTLNAFMWQLSSDALQIDDAEAKQRALSILCRSSLTSAFGLMMASTYLEKLAGVSCIELGVFSDNEASIQ